MQATYPLKPFPFQIVALVCALLAAAIIGGAGGYLLKSLDHQGTAAPAATVQQPSVVGENAAQPSNVYEQGGRPAAVYAAAAGAALTTSVASMLGENAHREALLGTHTTIGSQWTGSRAERDDLIGSTQQPSLVGENAQPDNWEKASTGSRR